MPRFDLVSAPTRQIAETLARYGPVELQPPGIDKAAFDRPTESPYGDGPAAVFAGVSPLFDYESLAAAAELAPNVAFHVIGPPSRPVPANVVFHPELPFEEIVPFLLHATFGLLLFPPGYASLGQGNKVAQYSYCLLPIVAPARLRGRIGRTSASSSRGDTESLGRALREGGADAALARVCKRASCLRGLTGIRSRRRPSPMRKPVKRDQRPPVQPLHARADDTPERRGRE